MILQAKWGSTVLCLFSGQGLHSCQRSSKCYHVCWASGEHFEIWICNEGKLLMCFVCRVLERPPRALSSPITIRRRDGKRPLFAQILSGHLKTFFLKFFECHFRAGAYDQLKQNATKARIPFYGSYTEVFIEVWNRRSWMIYSLFRMTLLLLQVMWRCVSRRVLWSLLLTGW